MVAFISLAGLLHAIAAHWIIAALAFVATVLGVDGGVLEAALIGAVISIGVSLVSSVLFKPKSSNEIVSFPPNSTTRGGYLPMVIGRRVVGCHIGWVGDRVSHAAPHAGGSEITPGPSSGNIYYEGGWHQLCHGPTRKLTRIWAGALTIASNTVDSTTAADGITQQITPTINARDGDYYDIYFGRDPNVDSSYQPLSAYLSKNTQIPSRWPGLTYVLWHRKNLGGAPQWPLMKYEIENRPDDIMTAAGLEDIFTPNGIPIWFDESTPSESGLVEAGVVGVTVWLNGKQNISAGTYTVTYLYGAMKLNAAKPYSVYSHDSLLSNFDMAVVDTSGTQYGYLPFINVGTNQFDTQAEAEAANAGATLSVTWPGGPMGFRVVDVFHRPGMVPGLPNPTYSVQLTTGGPTYAAAVAVSSGAPGSGDSGVNPAVALWILLCAGFPYGCGIDPSLIDQTALLAVATQCAAERLVLNILIENGRPAPDVIASIMADVGMLIPQVGGLIKPYLIRTETTIPEIPDSLRVGPPPEQQRVVGPIMGDRFTYQLQNVLNNYAISDITLDNDAQAFASNGPKSQQITLENVTSLIVGQQVAMRRTLETCSQPWGVPAFEVLREARSPQFHPGRAFLMDGIQYRVLSWKPDTVGISCEIGAVLDQYGDTSVTFDPSGGGDNYVVPPASPPMPDIFFNPFVIPRSEWQSVSAPIFGVPRVRDNDSVSGAFVWISNASSGTYNQIGSQDPASAGGTLLTAFNNSPGVLATGPAFSPYNDDTTDVPDLTGDLSDYADGMLTILCESEIMLVESLTANTDGSYTPNNVSRGAFNTAVANHSAGTPLVIVVRSDLAGLSSPLLASVSPAGGTLYIKTQPTDGNTLVDLSIVTPEPLVVPANLLATIQVTAPYGGQPATLGRNLVISWVTANLTGMLNIDLSEDGGVTWSSIAAGVADTGSYSWIVSAAATTTATIRVSSVLSPSVYAISYPFTIGGDTVTPDVMSATVSNFSSGANYSAGVYTVSYVSGAINYNTSAGTVLVVNGPSSAQEYVVVYNNGAATTKAPGLSTTFTTAAAVQAANLGQRTTIVHTGGTIGIYVSDTHYPDNASGPPAVTFSLSQ